MSTPSRFTLVVLATTAVACAQPTIEKAGTGGHHGGSGGAGGDDQGGSGGSRSSDGPDFGLDYPDAGTGNGTGGNGGAGGNGGTNVDDKSCAGELHEGKLVPLDILLLLDISGSMEESAGTQSKWTALHDALATFIEDPKSAGMAVGLETFPPPSKKCTANTDCGAGYCEEKGVCNTPANVATTEAACNAATDAMCTDEITRCTKYGLCAKSGLRCPTVGMACAGGATDMCGARPKFCVMPNAGCDATAYQTPIVPVSDLPAAVPTLETAMAGIVPEGTTPTTPAVTGALNYLRMRSMANPGRKPILVLATDGLPTECGAGNSIDAAAMQMSTAQMGMPSILTYVIGIFSSAQATRSQPALQTLATAGGTGAPFVLVTGNDLDQQLIAKLDVIRGAALGCEFTIPQPNAGNHLDFGELNVTVKTPTGSEDLVYVGNAAACDATKGGWYYDTDPMNADPTRVLLCDASCKKVKMTAGVSVDLRVGCKTIIK